MIRKASIKVRDRITDHASSCLISFRTFFRGFLFLRKKALVAVPEAWLKVKIDTGICTESLLSWIQIDTTLVVGKVGQASLFNACLDFVLPLIQQ